jgi:hypothetical protein
MCLSCGCDRPDDAHGDSRHITLTDLRCAAEAAGISTQQAAANIVATLRDAGAVKASGDDVACFVVKSDSDRRFTLGLAYGANLPDVGKAADGFQDFANQDVLEDAAWSYMQKSREIGLNHVDGTAGHGTVVESYIYRGPDWHLKAADGSDVVIKAGDWLLGVQWDAPTWADVKAGKYNGFSPQGRARRRTPSAETLANLRSR